MFSKASPDSANFGMNVEYSFDNSKAWYELEFRGESDMVCVLEYGDNIGTLRNLFREKEQAIIFAKHIIDLSEEDYTCIAANKWYCSQKNEYVEVQDL